MNEYRDITLVISETDTPSLSILLRFLGQPKSNSICFHCRNLENGDLFFINFHRFYRSDKFIVSSSYGHINHFCYACTTQRRRPGNHFFEISEVSLHLDLIKSLVVLLQ